MLQLLHRVGEQRRTCVNHARFTVNPAWTSANKGNYSCEKLSQLAGFESWQASKSNSDGPFQTELMLWCEQRRRINIHYIVVEEWQFTPALLLVAVFSQPLLWTHGWFQGLLLLVLHFRDECYQNGQSQADFLLRENVWLSATCLEFCKPNTVKYIEDSNMTRARNNI